MPLYPIVAQVPEGMRAEVMEYPLATGQTIRPGELLTLNADGDATELTAIDPTAILGVALSSNEAGRIIYESTVLVALAKGNTYFAFRGSRAPTQDDVGDVYGLIRDGEEWKVDFADVTATRVRIMEVHVDRALCICQILEAHRQIPV